MDINVTLFGEMLTFAVLVWVTMKYIWPPLIKAIEERQQKIAAGLEASERGKRELELAQTHITEQLQQAKIAASEILNRANQQANHVALEGKHALQLERTKVLAQTKLDIEQEAIKAEQVLRQHTVDLVLTTTEKILQEKVNPTTQATLIDGLIASISK